VKDMLGWPTLNEQKRGAAVAFFSELEDLIGDALAKKNNAGSVQKRSVAERRRQ
jgi:hypothetical protein